MRVSKHDAITEFFWPEGGVQTDQSRTSGYTELRTAYGVGLKHEFNSRFSPREMNITLFSTCYTYFIQSEISPNFPY